MIQTLRQAVSCRMGSISRRVNQPLILSGTDNNNSSNTNNMLNNNSWFNIFPSTVQQSLLSKKDMMDFYVIDEYMEPELTLIPTTTMKATIYTPSSNDANVKDKSKQEARLYGDLWMGPL